MIISEYVTQPVTMITRFMTKWERGRRPRRRPWGSWVMALFVVAALAGGIL